MVGGGFAPPLASERAERGANCANDGITIRQHIEIADGIKKARQPGLPGGIFAGGSVGFDPVVFEAQGPGAQDGPGLLQGAWIVAGQKYLAGGMSIEEAAGVVGDDILQGQQSFPGPQVHHVRAPNMDPQAGSFMGFVMLHQGFHPLHHGIDGDEQLIKFLYKSVKSVPGHLSLAMGLKGELRWRAAMGGLQGRAGGADAEGLVVRRR